MTDTLITGPGRLAGFVSRSIRKASNRLGVVQNGELGAGRVKKVRDEKLDIFDNYLESKQYEGLMDWEAALEQAEHVPIRKRKPRIIFNFAKILSCRVTSKLVGETTFPSFKIEDDPDTEEFIRAIVRASKLKSRIIDPMKKMTVAGSVFVRFFISAGVIQIEHFAAKHCFPEFLPNGELGFMMVRYVFEDKKDLDPSGRPKEKWFRMDFGQQSDIMYDNPEFKTNVEPEFTPVQTVSHGLGFVQGEWFRTEKQKDTPDGVSLIEDILAFIDDINYSLSQSSQAVSYNQDPQLILNKMDEEDITNLIRSSTKGWNLGREGEANFLESGLGGVETATDLRDRMRINIQDIARIVLLDPEKIIGSAQSAKAMEVLHGPMVELINELRPSIEFNIVNLVQKMALATLILNRQGAPVPVTIPQGFVPKSFDVNINWPPIFPMTIEDLQKRVAWVNSATSANLVSRETGTRLLAKDFGIEDIEEEVQKINEQPVLNPFGAF